MSGIIRCQCIIIASPGVGPRPSAHCRIDRLEPFKSRPGRHAHRCPFAVQFRRAETGPAAAIAAIQVLSHVCSYHNGGCYIYGHSLREKPEKPIPPLPTPARRSSSLAGSVACSRLYPRLVVLACAAQGEAGHEAGLGFRVANRSTSTKRRVDLIPMTRRLTRI